MHSSQNGTSGGIAFGGSTLPQPLLVRGTCLGCHGQGTPNKIVTIGGSEIPQVLHTDPSEDLAGGNFAYITGAKSRVTADQNSAGHNVIDLGAAYNETILTLPPAGHGVSNTNLTCAGNNGCHGWRAFASSGSGLTSLKGAHHNNVDGKCDTLISDNNVSKFYRFLMGIKGLEITGTYKYQNYNANNHNEYYGATTPMSVSGCGDTACHYTATDIRPASQTISGFCATCHGNFHTVEGIGGDISSPFTRHPTDISLPASGEYTAYTAYSTQAPVARYNGGVVPDTISPTVDPTGTADDIVMCLSCHAAHATPYADMLRWDYSTMIAGGGGSGGCFTCHTQKKNPP